MEKKVISVEEAAQELGIGRTHAYALAKRGELPVLRLGKRYVIPIARWNAWLAGERVA